MNNECSCMFSYGSPEFFLKTTVRARKAHTCAECRGVIHPGEQYHRVVGRLEGQFDSFKVCTTCEKIRRDLAPCASYGMLRDEVWYCHGVDINDSD